MRVEEAHLNSSLVLNPTLRILIQDLLNQDFALRNLFRTKNLEQIKNSILLNDSLDTDPSRLATKETLILILQELELEGLEYLPSESLESLFALPVTEPSEQDEAVVNDFYSVYSYFKKTSLPFSHEIKTKLLGQQLSLALESLGQKTLHPFLASWWPTRESTISIVCNPEKTDLELHPDLVTALNRLAALHKDLLIDPVFPTKAVSNSLHYILSVPNEGEFVPVPLEVGYLLFFFGQQEFLDRFLHNSLNIKGVEADEIVEFSFRMIRTHRLKLKAFSEHSSFNQQDLELMEEDYEALNRIFTKIHGNSASVEKEAA